MDDLPLVEVTPNMDNEDHTEEETPAGECANATPEPLVIKDVADHDRTDNLRHPVDEIVQGPGTDVKECGIVLVEF